MADRHGPWSAAASVQRRPVRAAGGAAPRVATRRFRIPVPRRRRRPAVLDGVRRGPVLEAPQAASAPDPAGLLQRLLRVHRRGVHGRRHGHRLPAGQRQLERRVRRPDGPHAALHGQLLPGIGPLHQGEGQEADVRRDRRRRRRGDQEPRGAVAGQDRRWRVPSPQGLQARCPHGQAEVRHSLTSQSRPNMQCSRQKQRFSLQRCVV